MNTVSLVGSVSRQAGGLFESVRWLQQALNTHRGPRPDQGSASADVQVSVLGARDKHTHVDLQAWRPIPVYPFDIIGPRAFGYTPGIVDRLLRLNPDLVHVHGLWQYPSLVALAWHCRSRRPYLVSPHGMLDPWALGHSRWKKHVAWLGYERTHLKTATCIRALCSAEVEAIRALGLRNPIALIPNGINLPQPHSETPDSSSSGTPDSSCSSLSGRKVLLYLGRIHPKKGLVPLLKAWAKATAANDWLLAIAGWDQDAHETELKTLATQLSLPWADGLKQVNPNTSVAFVGPQYGPDKRNWFERCHAFILPSFSEGLPMAILEAWAYAKPVLMTAQCNLPEGIAAGAAIPAVSTTEGISFALTQLFDCSDRALQIMGARGRALVSSHFSWPAIAADFSELYLWMLGSGPKPDCVITN